MNNIGSITETNNILSNILLLKSRVQFLVIFYHASPIFVAETYF